MPSMKPSRTHIAAAGTMVALGALTAVAIGAGGSEQPAKAVSAPKAQPVEVRTVVVHRTVKVVRHQKPKKAKPASAPPAPARSAPAVQIAQAPAPVQVSQPAPAKSYSKPLTTKSSGGASGGGEHESGEDSDSGEHEGGGDD